MNDYEEELVDVEIAIHRMAMLRGIFSDNMSSLSEQIMEDMLTIKTFIEKYCDDRTCHHEEQKYEAYCYTVQELIRELEKHDPTAPVGLSKNGCDHAWMCTVVEDEKNDLDGWLILSGGD